MENRNIYKMDDVLIVASFLMLIPAAYFSWPWLKILPQAEDISTYILSAPEVLGIRLNMVFLYLGGAVLAQLMGRLIRKQEKQALDVLDTILYMRNTTVDQLAANLAMPKNKVKKIIRKLTGIRSLNISLEGDSVKMDSPLSGTPVTKTPAPSPAPAAVLSENQSQSVHRADLEAKLKDSSFESMSPEQQKKVKKNAILMVILFMTPLWPVALIMVIVFVVRQAKGKGIMIQPAPMGEELPPEQE
jgi:hypothetical protein